MLNLTVNSAKKQKNAENKQMSKKPLDKFVKNNWNNLLFIVQELAGKMSSNVGLDWNAFLWPTPVMTSTTVTMEVMSLSVKVSQPT